MDEDILFRRYLSKLPLDLKNAAMSHSWPLDGEDNPHRKCKTWQDVADAVDMELDTRLDTRALLAHPGSVYAVHEGGGGETVQVCQHCQGTHHTVLCAARAAAVRNETETSERFHAKWGSTCQECGLTNHKQVHHLLAAKDFAALPGPTSKSKAKSKAVPEPPPQVAVLTAKQRKKFASSSRKTCGPRRSRYRQAL